MPAVIQTSKHLYKRILLALELYQLRANAVLIEKHLATSIFSMVKLHVELEYWVML